MNFHTNTIAYVEFALYGVFSAGNTFWSRNVFVLLMQKMFEECRNVFSTNIYFLPLLCVLAMCVCVCVCVCRCSEPECSLLTSCSQQLAEQVSQGTAFSSLNNNISQLLHQMCVVKFEVYIPISIMDISLLLCTLHSVFVSPCMSRSIVSPCTLCT